MKRETKLLDSKKSFWAIINDSGLQTSICELIDQPLYIYLKGPQLQPVNIRVDLDIERQCIRIQAKAGGVVEPDLDPLINARVTTNDRDQEMIAISGVAADV